MAKIYTRITWVDEVLSGSERYNIIDADGDLIHPNAQINLATAVTQAGTTANASRMNNIEAGIDALDTRLDYHNLTDHTSLVDADELAIYNSAGSSYRRVSLANLAVALGIPRVADGRLTLTSATPVTAADVTAATTLYYTPYLGNKIALYNGTRWVMYSFAEVSASLGGLAANTNYDVFLYNNSGTLTLDLTAWTNDTTRATTVIYQDGTLVKNGATGRRYLGTIRTTGTIGQTEDSEAKRFVWNFYNRAVRSLRIADTTNSWVYSTAAWRSANNSTANRAEVVVGQIGDAIDLYGALYFASSLASYGAGIAIGEDSTSAPTMPGNMGMFTTAPVNNQTGNASARFVKTPATVGYHYYQWLELGGGGAATTTHYGDAGTTVVQSGFTGTWKA